VHLPTLTSEIIMTTDILTAVQQALQIIVNNDAIDQHPSALRLKTQISRGMVKRCIMESAYQESTDKGDVEYLQDSTHQALHQVLCNTIVDLK
jgi:hypothetical protein